MARHQMELISAMGSMAAGSGGGHVGIGGPMYDPNGQRFATDPPSQKISKVKLPSEFILIADTVADGVDDLRIGSRDTSGIPGFPYSTGIGKIHRGGANVLFCDGHVQWHLQKDLLVIY